MSRAAKSPEWRVGNPLPRFDGSVLALLEFDDGTGSALYAGGAFGHAGGRTAERIAKWFPPVPANSDDLDGDGIFNEVDTLICDPSVDFIVEAPRSAPNNGA